MWIFENEVTQANIIHFIVIFDEKKIILICIACYSGNLQLQIQFPWIKHIDSNRKSHKIITFSIHSCVADYSIIFNSSNRNRHRLVNILVKYLNKNQKQRIWLNQILFFRGFFCFLVCIYFNARPWKRQKKQMFFAVVVRTQIHVEFNKSLAQSNIYHYCLWFGILFFRCCCNFVFTDATHNFKVKKFGFTTM